MVRSRCSLPLHPLSSAITTLLLATSRVQSTGDDSAIHDVSESSLSWENSILGSDYINTGSAVYNPLLSSIDGDGGKRYRLSNHQHHHHQSERLPPILYRENSLDDGVGQQLEQPIEAVTNAISTAATTSVTGIAANTSIITIATAGALPLNDRDRDWLQSHNSRRQQWHEEHGKEYAPLQWKDILKEESLVWAQFLANTNQFYHDPDKGPYGENLAMNSGPGGLRTTENILRRWVDKEADDDYPENGHLTQVLWRATKWVGCADAQNGNRYVQVCRYDRPGNCNMGDFDTWLEPMLADWSPCPTDCHPDNDDC